MVKLYPNIYETFYQTVSALLSYSPLINRSRTSTEQSTSTTSPLVDRLIDLELQPSNNSTPNAMFGMSQQQQVALIQQMAQLQLMNGMQQQQQQQQQPQPKQNAIQPMTFPNMPGYVVIPQ